MEGKVGQLLGEVIDLEVHHAGIQTGVEPLVDGPCADEPSSVVGTLPAPDPLLPVGAGCPSNGRYPPDGQGPL